MLSEIIRGTKTTLPANAKGQRMWYTYHYEPVMNMYVSRIDDAFGYSSEAGNFDYRYGMALRRTDLNRLNYETDLDNLGRIKAVRGPNELATGVPCIIAFDYQPKATFGTNGITAPAYAVTKHYDIQPPNDDMETVTFVDGFGRLTAINYPDHPENNVKYHYGSAKLACTMPSAANCRVELNAKEFDEETDLYYYGARYMDPQNSMWLGVDPLTEKYPNLTGYCYTNNNPVKYIDPTGTDWYRNDETAAIFWQEGNANSITYDGQEYRNIGETYSIYQSGMRYDYQQDKIIKVSDASGRFNVEGGQYIPKSFITDDGTKVSVTFKYKSPTGGYGDYALSKDAVSLLIKGINDANISGAGITSIDVSTTTTGKHSPSSNHYASNGGRAIDIDMVNGIPVKNPKSHEKVDAFQRAIRENPILRENFGPNIQEKEGKTKRISGHNNHIHIATQKR